MNPTALTLRNFLSYRQDNLDLARLHLAVLVGDNGSGKSSLLDAVTWALFGESTKGGLRALDNHVTRGEDEAEVSLTFLLGGATYRVTRSRNIPRNKSGLDFAVQTAEGWRSLNGKALAETQTAIEATLRMDYRTFTASSLILQGQSDSFTADMTDAERKEALGRILGLDVWDRVQERAREILRDVKAKSAVANTNAARAQEQAKRLPELLVTQHDLEQALDRGGREEAELEAKLAEARKREAERQAERNALDALVKDIPAHRAALEQAQNRLSQLSRDLAEAERIAAQRDDVLARARWVESLRAEVSSHDLLASTVQAAKLRAQEAFSKRSSWDLERKMRMERWTAELDAAERQAALLGEVPCNDLPELATQCKLLANARLAAAKVADLVNQLEPVKVAVNPHIAADEEATAALVAASKLYDAVAHGKARESLRANEPVLNLVPKVEAAVQVAAGLRDQIADAQARVAECDATLKRAEAQSSRVWEVEQLLRGASHEAAVAVNDLLRLRQYERQERDKLGMTRLDIERTKQAALEAETLAVEQVELGRQATLYSLVEAASSKQGGVPALVVENAVPEIERRANELLDSITEGRLRVALLTQAETKIGTQREVLRIIILDGGGERPYQTYSGAERFIVDLSLRVAISKFLAHRAGAEIGLFVLDEGLGSCDASNRDAVMNALSAVSRDFAKVLVVTHLAELQEAFPQRVEVVKTAAGSAVSIHA